MLRACLYLGNAAWRVCWSPLESVPRRENMFGDFADYAGVGLIRLASGYKSDTRPIRM